MAGDMTYISWLQSKIGPCPSQPEATYTQLFDQLNNMTFFPVMTEDSNRYMDGVGLRGRYLTATGHLPESRVDGCSILDMLAALAIRCEEDIMDRPCGESRIGEWFWRMIDELGLTWCDDEHAYNPLYVRDTIDRLNYRTYAPDGAGGLFRLKRPPEDMRNVEIWAQMMWKLNELIQEGLV